MGWCCQGQCFTCKSLARSLQVAGPEKRTRAPITTSHRRYQFCPSTSSNNPPSWLIARQLAGRITRSTFLENAFQDIANETRGLLTQATMFRRSCLVVYQPIPHHTLFRVIAYYLPIRWDIADRIIPLTEYVSWKTH
jgi:hypothetical protein